MKREAWVMRWMLALFLAGCAGADYAASPPVDAGADVSPEVASVDLGTPDAGSVTCDIPMSAINWTGSVTFMSTGGSSQPQCQTTQQSMQIVGGVWSAPGWSLQSYSASVLTMDPIRDCQIQIVYVSQSATCGTEYLRAAFSVPPIPQ